MLKQKFFLDFLSRLIISSTTVISGLIVARVAGPQVVGILSYSLAYVSIFSFIIHIFGSSYIKLVSQGEFEPSCNTNYFYIILLSITSYIVITLIFFYIQKNILQYRYESTEVEIVIIISLIAFIFNQLYTINEVIFNAKIQIIKANLPSLFKTVTYNILRVIFVLLGSGAIGLSVINLITTLIFLPIILFNFIRLKFGKWDKYLFKKSINISIPILGITIIDALINNLDKLIIEYYSNLQQVGYYSVSNSIAGIFLIISTTTGTIFFPLFSSYFSTNDLTSIKEKIYLFKRFFFILIQPILLGLFVFSDSIIITLLDNDFQPSINIFRIMIINSYCLIWSMPFGNVITGMGKFWKALEFHSIRFFVFLVSFILIGQITDINAFVVGIIVLIQNITLSFLLIFYVKSALGINILEKNDKYFLIIGSIYIIILLILNYYIFGNMSAILNTVIFLPLSILIMYFFFYLLGLIQQSDYIIIMNIISIKKIINYFNSELKIKSR